MLGKLATYLRMCGYDAAYALDRGVEDDDRLRDLAAAEDRRLLTRDADLAARTPNALLIESLGIEDQLRELLAAGYDLAPAAEPGRCGACNGPLERVDPGEQTPPYAPDPDQGAETVWRCTACGQHFWKGSHWRDVVERLRSL